MSNRLSLDRIYQAAFTLKEVARKTDLIYSPHFSGKNQVYFKTENLQVTGSFKLRGAYFKISRLTDEEKAAGIVACSAGNHAQGVALAAKNMGIKATICMPDGAPISKVQATKSYGAEVALVKGAYDDAYQYACKLQEEEHATFIHPFDDPDVIVVPVGGGGLISGVAYAAKSLKPDIKVYGVQAKEAASMADSLKYDEQVTLNTVNTFADGIAVKHPGDLTFELIKDYVDGVVTVTEDEIAVAILALIEKQKLIAEGAGAVSLAAVMADKIPVEGKNVVCLVSGGNIDVNILSRVITRGLVTSGRNATLMIALEDKPGQLVDVATIIASCGANVTGVHYGHSDPNTAVTSCVLTLEIETRDFEQLEQVRSTLTAEGFNLVQ